MHCGLIQMNRKMHGCQLIKSLDKMLQFLSDEGSCDTDWLNDVAEKIENAQMVFGQEEMENCSDEIWPIEEIRVMNKKFFQNEKKTLQVYIPPI